jgi:hypothetical protein
MGTVESGEGGAAPELTEAAPKSIEPAAQTDAAVLETAVASRRSVGRVVTAIPRLMRFAVTAGFRTTTATAVASGRIGAIVTRAAADGEQRSEAVDQVAAEAADLARKVLDAVEPVTSRSPVSMPPAASTAAGVATGTVGAVARGFAAVTTSGGNGRAEPAAQTAGLAPWLRVDRADVETLKGMYAALIDQSNDVHHRQEHHPAYVRVMQELTPDEARILRLLATGPQPALDIRTAGTFGFGSKLIKPGITMIAAFAGCQDAERVPAYLNNLNRLGLIWFSREMIGDVNSYALLEAQPEVMDIAHQLGGKKSIRNTLRSIELTAFGKNLCALCGLLPREELQARASLGEVSQRLPAPDER